mmetsp:Transcript_128543/g.333229  ORF Transcript_128543/g.333229 Transcript_128543/m.333229 type:complete len:83 (-) Transcript_128543:14-262(-)
MCTVTRDSLAVVASEARHPSINFQRCTVCIVVPCCSGHTVCEKTLSKLFSFFSRGQSAILRGSQDKFHDDYALGRACFVSGK